MQNPQISVVIPCFNEEKTITALLEAIRTQTIGPETLEVLISDGFSTDNTRHIIQDYAAAHPELAIHVLDNEKRIIPAGLNQAIRAAKGEIIVRMDAHTLPAADYIARSVEALRAGHGDNVGGVIDIKPGRDSRIARSIAVATAHPLGVGDAKYRWATKAGYADTVAFGCYYKATVEKVGYYNEALAINEDYEFNARLRALGMKIWVDPAIRAVYFSRPDLASLARQYYLYGFWKLKMLRLYPQTLRWRQALPPLFVFVVLMLLLSSILWSPLILLLAAVLLLYVLLLVAGTMKPAKKQKNAALLLGVPLAIMTMHFSWGTGFWMSLFQPGKKEK